MIEFFKSILNGFKIASTTKKTLYSSLILIYIISIVLLSVKINVEVITPGGINAHIATEANLSSNEFANSNSLSVFIHKDNNPGEIYTVGVHSKKGVSIFQYLISKFNKDIDLIDYNPKNDLSPEEDLSIGKKSKDVSIINALIVAYEEAKKVDNTINIDYEFEGVLVAHVFKSSNNGLKADDIITHLNGVKIQSDTFRRELTKIDKDTEFILTVKRYDSVAKLTKEIEVPTKKYLDNVSDLYLLGVSVMDSYKINEETAFPKFAMHNNYPSVGGSGGAMQALAIYNALTEKDITKGKRIIGTGTISVDTFKVDGDNLVSVFGQVGDIGGVSQKIITAKLYTADIFFVNPEDYIEARDKALEIEAGFKVVEVKTFKDIIDYLEGESNE